MLSLEGIGHVFGMERVIDRVSLRVAPGESVCLVGPSGCGKTTLLRIAAGLVEPTEGRVNDGFRRSAMVFQEGRLLPWRRLLDNIALGLKAMGVPRRERLVRARALAAELGLADRHDHFPHELSGGMQQRVALARALAVEADCLLLDEPFSALDVGMRSEAQALLLDLLARRGIAALMVTHDLTEALRLGHRVVVLSPAPGRIVHEERVTRPFAERDTAFLFEAAGALLRHPAVAESFLFQSREVTA
ncbi:ATP-binding cassette domain-containing protein [Halomonas campisalis]|uniref:ATP-binding cassette domain-containing protein n=1 Tax=Billgrantia campisalis TaxID=74661 RepID=A0ABS9PBL1_9GAMM|nr:ATP-binding cassette domain-containing protein [Halomonas campisalis]MCG6659121.1 ATP-binding cassette domain-containing protein [Halomonas campisalis]MDR5863844.1 ATP-binding cassette domain-containing protein [Halomonas campisalis]